jgi:hypothetical protein
MRLSRTVLTGLVGIGAIVVFSALIFALYQGNRRPGGGSLALSACALREPPPLERGYSTHYRGHCEKHDLCDFHGGTGY